MNEKKLTEHEISLLRGVVRLTENLKLETVESLARRFGMTRSAAYSMLKKLQVPVFHAVDQAWYNIYSLGYALFYLLDVGGPGFAAPGSRKKARGYGRDGAGDIAIELADKEVVKMRDPKLLVRMMMTGPANKVTKGPLLESLMRWIREEELESEYRKRYGRSRTKQKTGEAHTSSEADNSDGAVDGGTSGPD